MEKLSPSKRQLDAEVDEARSQSEGATMNTFTVFDDDRVFDKAYFKRFSPRSNEACSILGILPEELIPTSMDDFDSDELLQVRQLRFDAKERRRIEALEAVRQERNRLVEMGWQPLLKIEVDAEIKPPLAVIEQALGEDKVEMLAREKERLRKLMLRQESELEQMIQFEMKMYKVEEKQKQKEAQRKKREDMLQRERAKQLAEIQQRKRARELRQNQEEERELQRRKRLQEQMYRKAQKAQQEQRIREKEKRAEMRQKALERNQRQMQLKERTENILNEQQKIVAKKLADLEIRERIRQKRNAEAKQEEIAERVRKQQEKNLRVRMALQRNDETLEEMRARVGYKLQSETKRLEDQAKYREKSIAAARMTRSDSEDRRRKVKDEADREQMARVHLILDKNRKAEEKRNELAQQRNIEQAVKKELASLRLQEKWANIDRKKRADEYKRRKTVEKIEHDAERTRLLQKVKQDMVQERKRNKILVEMQKEEVLKVFQQLRLSDGWKNLPQNAGNIEATAPLLKSIARPLTAIANKQAP